MERLAKEKVAQQKKILILKRELSVHFEHGDSSFLLPENELNGNGSIRERCKYFVNTVKLLNLCPRWLNMEHVFIK